MSGNFAGLTSRKINMNERQKLGRGQSAANVRNWVFAAIGQAVADVQERAFLH